MHGNQSIGTCAPTSKATKLVADASGLFPARAPLPPGCGLRQALAIVARPASTTKRALSTSGAPGRVT